ncbi:MAG: DNA repair protein RadA, partial [Hoylesella buccalis]
MAKEKIAYVCSNCGQDSPKWMGKCPNCGQWNTFKEIRIGSDTSQSTARSVVNAFKGNTEKNKPLRLKDISTLDEPRIDMHDDELNRVLGGGLVSGSITLLGGEPGIGKST